jgi:alpha-beta hydrolase superfamily lysophospholipase
MKTFESHWERDGITFFMQGWEPGEEIPKAVVGLVHGIGEHSGRYAHVGTALTEAGYALVSFDLRGHGKSGGGRGHFPSFDAVVQDIRQFFVQISRRYPEVPYFLYGHSLGGLLALAYSIQFSAGLKGVIVSAPALRSALQEQKAKIAIVNILGSLFPTLTLNSGLDASTTSRDLEVVKKYNDDPLTHDKASLGFGKSALQAIDLCVARARDFSPPLLLMHGTADKLNYPSGTEDFAKLAKESNPDVTLKLWDGLYHELHNEPEKNEVFTFVIAWLDAHLK